nr:mulatexin-like [Chelonoidis abingdonii]
MRLPRGTRSAEPVSPAPSRPRRVRGFASLAPPTAIPQRPAPPSAPAATGTSAPVPTPPAPPAPRPLGPAQHRAPDQRLGGGAGLERAPGDVGRRDVTYNLCSARVPEGQPCQRCARLTFAPVLRGTGRAGGDRPGLQPTSPTPSDPASTGCRT